MNEFFEQYAEYAIAEQKRSGIPASITLAQAALESGWGGSGLTEKALNFFGIKAGKDWEGETYFATTKEFVNGQYETQLAAFRKYDSAAGSFADHSDFLLSNPRYKDALEVAAEPYRMAGELQKAGYATDPAYASKLINIIKENNLTAFDLPGAKAPTPTADRPWWDIKGKAEDKMEDIADDSKAMFTQLAQNTLVGVAIILVLAVMIFIGYQVLTVQGGAKQA